jgi:hypothetical protein
VHVRGAEQERERDAAGVDDDVPLRPGLPRSVGWLFIGFQVVDPRATKGAMSG